ncbi:hypothetical protein WS58_15960 [Burkholderia pseudomultivorans]|nr:hypothetical protein WS58_15960 [Burkholderia pseudomultivorans]
MSRENALHLFHLSLCVLLVFKAPRKQQVSQYSATKFVFKAVKGIVRLRKQTTGHVSDRWRLRLPINDLSKR